MGPRFPRRVRAGASRSMAPPCTGSACGGLGRGSRKSLPARWMGGYSFRSLPWPSSGCLHYAGGGSMSCGVSLPGGGETSESPRVANLDRGSAISSPQRRGWEWSISLGQRRVGPLTRRSGRSSARTQMDKRRCGLDMMPSGEAHTPLGSSGWKARLLSSGTGVRPT